MVKILGLACSLRNARWGAGNQELVAALHSCDGEEQLKAYLSRQSNLHLQNFVESGRAEGKHFEEIYKNLKQLKGDRGLSNSEVCLAAALWSAMREGCEIEHLSVSDFFPASGAERRIDELKAALRAADGLIISGPVYFGDRGSLAQQVVNMINEDEELKIDLENKVYVGIAVGAKRNGGQETTLIYQLCDMVNLGFLGVGNDSDTTAQYGGTVHAGDVGTAAEDHYGLWTAMGAGRRVAKVAESVMRGRQRQLAGKPRLQFWILQDRDGIASRYTEALTAGLCDEAEIKIIDLSTCRVARCIACDICPASIGKDEVYRCIIKGGKHDQLEGLHNELLNTDAIVPVIFSPVDGKGLKSNYQQFIERTRYLRRGDYVFSDILTAPLVVEEIGALQNMHMRALTSMVRHHTVITVPMVANLHKGAVLNDDQVRAKLKLFLKRARLLASGRLQTYMTHRNKYEPVGYILSADKDREDKQIRIRDAMVRERNERLAVDAQCRLSPDKSAKAL